MSGDIVNTWLALPALLGIALVTTQSSSAQGGLPDWQARCEAAADGNQPKEAVRRLAARVERRIDLPGSARLLGAEWNYRTSQLILLDAEDRQLLTLDTAGRVRSKVARPGEGPGELLLSPVYIGSRQKFRSDSGHRILVLDDRRAQIFDGNQLSRQVRLDSLAPALGTDAHVARTQHGWLVSLARRGQPDMNGQSQVRLFLIQDTPPSPQATLIAFVRNVLSEHGASGGSITSDYPYDRLFRRTWDASGLTVAILAYRRFAICFHPLAEADSWRAWILTAPPRKVDAAERDRVLRERFGRSSGPVPMAGGRIEDVYKGKWPDYGPFYYDLTALTGTLYAALRLDAGPGVAADFFDVVRGYRGTVTVPAERTVLGGYANGLLLLDFQNSAVELLRVEQE